MLRQEQPSAVSASGSWLIVFQLYALSHMHTHWQVIRVSDRMQAKPFSVFIHLPYIHYPEVLRTVTRGPRAPKACLTMTTDLWQPVSEAPPHHTCMFSSLFTLSVHLLCSLFCFFYFVALLPTTLWDSGFWLKQSPLKLAVPLSPRSQSHTGSKRQNPFIVFRFLVLQLRWCCRERRGQRSVYPPCLIHWGWKLILPS